MLRPNIYLNNHSPTHHHHGHQTVTHHRAPTDDSIRLYDEMLDKARNEIVGKLKVENNIASFKAVAFEVFQDEKTVCKYEVVINGHVISKSVEVCRWEHDSVQKVVEHVARSISNHLTEKIMEKLWQDFQ